MRRPTADLMLLATVSLWALNFTVSKYILDQGFHPLAYSSIRYAAAALVFAAITFTWERSLRIGRRDVPLAAGCVVMLFANQLCFVYALDFTTATTTALLFGTLPIWTGLLARGTGVERQSLRFWLAAGLSFAGVVLVAVGSGGKVSTNLLWFTAIDRVGPSRASLFANLQPFLAAIVALLVLSERITGVQAAGGLALAAGIVLAPKARPPAPDAD